MGFVGAAQERNTRRSRVYSGRITRSVLGSGLRHPTIFLHLPKCGGTSLSDALFATVPIHRRIGVIDALATRRAASLLEFGVDDAWKCHDDLEFGDRTFDLRERLLITYCCWNSQLVSGHVLMTDRVRDHFCDAYKFITVMRDPVGRAISNYRMAVFAGIADPDPEVWLNSPIARAHSTTYLRYLSGRHSVSAEDEGECLERAFSALEMFTLIGFLDRIDAFVDQFEAGFGARLKMHNYNRAKGAETRLSEAQMTRLHEMCSADRAIYARARALMSQD